MAANSALASQMKEWCKNTNNQWIWDQITAFGPLSVDTQRLTLNARRVEASAHCKLQIPTQLGRLALKEEAAGKIRVFAMVDAFTQWALYPLHQQIMSTLSTWVQDGTFDQYKPVKVLLSRKPLGLWSYDLSAATDRLPLQFQKIVLQPILGIKGAEVWGDILVKRDYYFGTQNFRYAVGQPMGAYSS